MSATRRPARVVPVLLGVLLAALLVACAGPRSTPSPPDSDNSAAHAYPELEARLPSEVGGHQMSKVSVAAPPDEQSARTLELLRRLSKTPADLQVAVATGDGGNIQVGAMRVVGSDGVQLAVNFQSVEEDDPASIAVYSTAEIGGKRLLTRTAESQLTYLYPAGDTMFMLSGEVGLVEKALALLP